jgi:hypothetical protein
MSSNELPDFLDSKTERELKQRFQKLELENAGEDEWYQWRIRVNHALSDEGVNITWSENEDSYALVQLIIRGETGREDFLQIPILHLRDLYEQDANEKAVASYIKALLYDERFKLWRMEEEGEDY